MTGRRGSVSRIRDAGREDGTPGPSRPPAVAAVGVGARGVSPGLMIGGDGSGRRGFGVRRHPSPRGPAGNTLGGRPNRRGSRSSSRKGGPGASLSSTQGPGVPATPNAQPNAFPALTGRPASPTAGSFPTRGGATSPGPVPPRRGATLGPSPGTRPPNLRLPGDPHQGSLGRPAVERLCSGGERSGPTGRARPHHRGRLGSFGAARPTRRGRRPVFAGGWLVPGDAGNLPTPT